MRCDNIALNVFVKCDQDQEVIYIMAIYPQRIPDGNREALNELIVRINAEGSRDKAYCTWSREDQTISFGNHIFISDTDFKPGQFKRVFHDCMDCADVWYPAFMELIYGDKTAEEAYALALEQLQTRTNRIQQPS